MKHSLNLDTPRKTTSELPYFDENSDLEGYESENSLESSRQGTPLI